MTDKIEGFLGNSYVNVRERGCLLKLMPDDGLMLEIGTADGATIGWLASRKPKAYFVSVDIFPVKDSGVTGALGSFGQWRANAQPNQALWVGTARLLAEVFPVSCFDLTLVDGEHTEEACLEDLQAAGVLTDPAGIIALHDYKRPCNGVQAAFKAWSRGWHVAEVIGSTALLRRSEDKELEQRLRSLGYA